MVIINFLKTKFLILDCKICFCLLIFTQFDAIKHSESGHEIEILSKKSIPTNNINSLNTSVITDI